jgi:NAD(P)-dependent dehydrogenase (short-subunit alcohol dehydrogenase family)
MPRRFENQVVAITGGSTGIGLAAAKAFLEEGAARVYITGRTSATLEAAARGLGERVVAVVADVAQAEGRDRLQAEIATRHDRLDVVFANAGVAEKNIFGETAEAEFDHTFGINVKGLFFTVQSLLPHLRDGGAVVLNASIVANKGLPELSLYNASKAAVRSFARSWANDLKARNIRVNAVSPGITRTPILENGLKMDADQIAGMEAYARDAVPAGRFARPEEIAQAVLFVASRDASYVNGIELTVDGGLSQI